MVTREHVRDAHTHDRRPLERGIDITWREWEEGKR
jgi:hypothetical protein